jgi:hypothetical protein
MRALSLCTQLWTSCADMPPKLWTAVGVGCGLCSAGLARPVTACNDAQHRLCAEEMLALRTCAQWRQVLHTRYLTFNVTDRGREASVGL